MWLGDFQSLPPLPDPSPPEGLFSIPTRQTVGMNQILADNGDLIRIDPVDALRPFSMLSTYLAELPLGGGGQDNDVDAIHVLDDGRIVFSTASGELSRAADSIKPNPALGQIDAFIYDPTTNTSTIATGIPGLVFPVAFASAEDDKLDALHVLDDGSTIFSTEGAATLGTLSFEGNDLIHWDGETATMVFQASTQLVGARLYTGVFGSQTQVGTVSSDIGDEITAVHVLSFAADGITPDHFVINTGDDIKNAANGLTVLDRTQLIEVFRDEHGVYWVNSVPYFNSGDDSPADTGEEIDAVWLGDIDALAPLNVQTDDGNGVTALNSQAPISGEPNFAKTDRGACIFGDPPISSSEGSQATEVTFGVDVTGGVVVPEERSSATDSADSNIEFIMAPGMSLADLIWPASFESLELENVGSFGNGNRLIARGFAVSDELLAHSFRPIWEFRGHFSDEQKLAQQNATLNATSNAAIAAGLVASMPALFVAAESRGSGLAGSQDVYAATTIQDLCPSAVAKSVGHRRTNVHWQQRPRPTRSTDIQADRRAASKDDHLSAIRRLGRCLIQQHCSMTPASSCRRSLH